MKLLKRAVLYSVRKKGKTLTLFLLIGLVSTFLLSCFSILSAVEKLNADIRKSIGAAFYIRANSNVVKNDKGEFSIEDKQIHITDDNISEIEQSGEVAYCNPINYGYAKGENIKFIPGDRDNPDNNMGQITALRYSFLHSDFSDKVISLSDGKHIDKTSEKTVIISREVALANGISLGDKVVLTSAEFGADSGKYIDTWQGARNEVEVIVTGIYEILKENNSVTATAAKQENRIYASLDVLSELGESEPSVYTGEVDFYVIDPAELTHIVPKVRKIDSIDWETHFIRTNDFQYSKISESMETLSGFVKVLLICVSLVSAAIITLILTLNMRNRVRESGILLAVGISKKEILTQFILETLMAAFAAFIASYIAYYAIQGGLANVLFADYQPNLITDESIKNGVEFGLGILKIILVYLCQLIVIVLSVVISSMTILRLKPKEILNKMS